MKKISDYVRVAPERIVPVIAEVIDNDVMLVYTANEFNKKQWNWSHKYQIVDRATKILVCFANTRKEVFEKFEECKPKYYEFQKTRQYEKLVKHVNQMIEFAKITKELETPEVE